MCRARRNPILKLHLASLHSQVIEGSGGGGQTREHAQLARSLGVEQVAVVVSKLDMVDHPKVRISRVPVCCFLCGVTSSR
jgi:translation elongation factor EF-1alpha